MKRRMCFLSLIIMAATGLSGWEVVRSAPAATAASGTAAAVLTWLSGLPTGIRNRVASGFFGGYSGSGFSTTQIAEVHDLTGTYPAILGCDYGSESDAVTDPTALIDYSCNESLKAWSASGGLVAVSVRAPNPEEAQSAGLTAESESFGDLTDPTTPVGSRWRSYLDKIAAGLADLRAAGVPVLFRPFHDMNGDRFWWAGQSSATFKLVWRNMYTYFKNAKILNNVLWVYSPDAHQGDLVSYYPGSAYVDVVALDAFDDNPGNSTIVIAYQQLVSLGKPFAFAALGPGTPGGFDYRKWINAIKQQYPKTTYFMAWNNGWGPQHNKNGASLMGDAWVISREEVRLR